MRNLIILGLVLLLLALNCEATAPMQLSGIGGHTTLAKVSSANITTEVINASANDLWNWGKIPLNYALNNSGILYELGAGPEEDNAWLETRLDEVELNTTDYA